LCGNHLLEAAKRLGWSEISAVFLGVDDEEALRILLIDNRASDGADYDTAQLVELLGSLPSLEGTGFDGDELEKLLADLAAEDGGADRLDVDLDDDGDDGDGEEHDHRAGEGTDRDRARGQRLHFGEVALLDRHRLVCGDPRDSHAWTRLLDGERPSVLIGDATQLEADADPDDDGGHAGLLGAVFAVADDYLDDGAAIYVFRGTGTPGVETLIAVRDRWRLDQELVWLHRPPPSSALRYAPAHGQIVLAQKATLRGSAAATETATEGAATSVWAPAKMTASASPATELYALAIERSSSPGGGIVDPFANDAETLLACEASGRTAYLLQPDPARCEQILDAWQDAGGASPRRGD
jgi:hypothetical protein